MSNDRLKLESPFYRPEFVTEHFIALQAGDNPSIGLEKFENDAIAALLNNILRKSIEAELEQ